MFKTGFKIRTIGMLLAAAGGLATATAGAAPGNATGTVSIVEVNHASNSRLLVQVGGANYLAVLVAPGGTCGSSFVHSADEIRAFQTVAEAALLAGKNVKVYFDDCGTANKYITALDLQQ